MYAGRANPWAHLRSSGECLPELLACPSNYILLQSRRCALDLSSNRGCANLDKDRELLVEKTVFPEKNEGRYLEYKMDPEEYHLVILPQGQILREGVLVSALGLPRRGMVPRDRAPKIVPVSQKVLAAMVYPPKLA